jgi:8-oxo-dGTP pyrophosphatase MutT (NUDIX family)
MSKSTREALEGPVPPSARPLPIAQLGALCWRHGKSGVEVLMITSSQGRWILPKGWPIDGLSEPEAALQEAWEEAGVKRAKTTPLPVGGYDSVIASGQGRNADRRPRIARHACRIRPLI